MIRFLAMALVMVVANLTYGSEPGPTRSIKKSATTIQPNDFQRVLIRLAERDRRRSQTAIEMLTALASPQPLAHQIPKVLIDPNERMATILKESEDLREAAREMQRFWMNNQPAVRNFKGGIGR